MRAWRHPATRTWALLMLLTAAGFASADYGAQGVAAVAAVMAFSALKVRLVLYRFMELGATPRGLRIFFNIWLVFCAAMIFGLFWLALSR
ncbi:MAG: cytochrome C oxidase subunit IV family protein [Gammaproteobacteria bacterium]